MHNSPSLTLAGCAAGGIGYVAFAGLTFAGVAAAPVALLLIPAGVVLAATAKR